MTSLKVDWTWERITAVWAALNLPGVQARWGAVLPPLFAEAGTEAPDPAAVLTVNLDVSGDVLDGFEAALLDALPLLAQDMVDAKTAGPPSAYAAAQASAAHTYAALQDIRTHRTALREANS